MLIVDFSLDVVYIGQSRAHLFDLLGLGMRNVRLPSDLVVKGFHFVLRVGEAVICLSEFFFGFGVLDLDVAEGVFQFFVFERGESQHLFVFVFRAF